MQESVPLSKQGGPHCFSGPGFSRARNGHSGLGKAHFSGSALQSPPPSTQPTPVFHLCQQTSLFLPKIATVGPMTRNQFPRPTFCFLPFQAGKGGAQFPASPPTHTPASLRQPSPEPRFTEQLLSFPISPTALGFSSHPGQAGMSCRSQGAQWAWPEWPGRSRLSRKPGPWRGGGSGRDSRGGGRGDDLPIVSGRDSSS